MAAALALSQAKPELVGPKLLEAAKDEQPRWTWVRSFECESSWSETYVGIYLDEFWQK